MGFEAGCSDGVNFLRSNRPQGREIVRKLDGLQITVGRDTLIDFTAYVRT